MNARARLLCGTLFVLGAVLIGGCGDDEAGARDGTDTGAPTDGTDPSLLGFAGSACKDGEPEELFDAHRLVTLEDSAPYSGLYCLSWQTRDDGVLRLDVINHGGACAVSYRGVVSVGAGGDLTLDLINDACDVGACGECVYDWSFEVAGVAPDQDLELAIRVTDFLATCEMEGFTPPAPLVETTTIPANELARGIRCRHMDPRLLFNGTAGGFFVGEQNGPCRPADGTLGPDAAVCDAGLVCVEASPVSGNLCYAPCAGDSDCSLPELFSCQQGICELSKPWV